MVDDHASYSGNHKRRTSRHIILIQKLSGNYLKNPRVLDSLNLIDDILVTLHPLAGRGRSVCIFIPRLEEWILRHATLRTSEFQFVSLNVAKEEPWGWKTMSFKIRRQFECSYLYSSPCWHIRYSTCSESDICS